MKRKAPVTMALLVMIAIVFAFEVLTKAYESGEKMVTMGAITHDLVLHGEIWRLITYMFLHGGWLHWLSNSWVLYQLGTLYEVLFGSRRFAAIYFATGVIAGLASAILHAGPAVGASGAVFGIMGAFFFSIWRSPLYRGQRWTRSLLGQLLFWIALNIFIGYKLPFIDNTAHIAGLIAGLILGLIPHRVPPPPPRDSVIDVAWDRFPNQPGRTGESDLRPPQN
jgi:rhomboid protease GluP